jgi:uroporphyrinogen-III synthase
MIEQGRNDKVLAQISVLVTRGAHQAEELSRKIIDLGGAVREFPVIAIQPPKSFAELDKSLDQIEQYDWIVFASANAVDYLLARYRERGLDERLLEQCRIAAIGPATSNALTRHGFKAHFMPKSFIADALVDEFQARFDLTGKKLLWPRTTVGRQLIKAQLTIAGAEVDMVTAYETVLPPESIAQAIGLLDLIENRTFDIILMASSQSVRNFATILKIALQQRQWQGKHHPGDATTDADLPLGSQALEFDAQLTSTGLEIDGHCASAVPKIDGQFSSTVLGTTQILTIGPQTSKTVEEQFGYQPLEARTFTIQGMIDRLIEYVQTVGNKSCSAGESETQAEKLGKNL